jgi:hypothetical protein
VCQHGSAGPCERARDTMAGGAVLPLFRLLLRSARAHDRNPALKALLTSRRTTAYDRRQGQWTDIAVESDTAAGELQRHTNILFGGGENCVRAPIAELCRLFCAQYPSPPARLLRRTTVTRVRASARNLLMPYRGLCSLACGTRQSALWCS